jgi:putative glycosyltransferase
MIRNERIPRLTIVTTLFCSADFLPSFIARTEATLALLGIDNYEIILVDDGSPDRSLTIAKAAIEDNRRIRVVELSRNFGHHHAALAGLHHAQGQRVFLIDCDLEVAPEVLKNFVRVMDETSADVVYGVQERRTGGFVKRIGGSVFWKLFNWLSDTPVPADVLTERLMTDRYVKALIGLGDRNLFLAGMMYWTGFRQVAMTVEKSQREGKPSYSLWKRCLLLIEAVTSSSTVPLTFMLCLGVVITLLAVVASGWLLLNKALHPEQIVAGYTSLALLTLGLGGVIITFMGVLGLYVARIFTQTQGRPPFIVRAVHDAQQNHTP